MNKILITFLILSFINFSILAQENSNSKIYAQNTESTNTENTYHTNNVQNMNQQFDGYWTFGGNIGLSFWNDGTDILIAPKAYYNISPILITGFGLTYIYSDYKTNYNTYKNNAFGGSVFLGVRPTNFLQISAEYEGLQTNRSGSFNDEYWNNSLYLGISFVSGRVSFGLRYDVLYDNYRSPYSSALNPVVGLYF